MSPRTDEEMLADLYIGASVLAYAEFLEEEVFTDTHEFHYPIEIWDRSNFYNDLFHYWLDKGAYGVAF